ARGSARRDGGLRAVAAHGDGRRKTASSDVGAREAARRGCRGVGDVCEPTIGHARRDLEGSAHHADLLAGSSELSGRSRVSSRAGPLVHRRGLLLADAGGTMRQLAILAVALGFVGCSDNPYNPNGPAIDPNAPRVHITSPKRGTIAGDVHTVTV